MCGPLTCSEMHVLISKGFGNTLLEACINKALWNILKRHYNASIVLYIFSYKLGYVKINPNHDHQ